MPIEVLTMLAMMLGAPAGVVLTILFAAYASERRSWREVADRLDLTWKKRCLVGTIEGHHVRVDVGQFPFICTVDGAAIPTGLATKHFNGDDASDLAAKELAVLSHRSHKLRSEASIIVSSGSLKCDAYSVGVVEARVNEMVALAQELTAAADDAALVEGLVTSASSFPYASVRAQSVRCLGENFIESDVAKEAILDALTDADDEVRTEASQYVDMETALELMGTEGRPILARSTVLCKVWQTNRVPESTMALCAWDVLEHRNRSYLSADSHRIAVKVIGETGDGEAITRFRALDASFVREKDLKVEVKSAIQLIQSRLDIGGAGSLSLANESDRGTLSLSKLEQGAVGLVKPADETEE